MRPRVLVVADYYLPGFRAGGPVRAVANTIARLASTADFFVVTRDHDADGSKHRGIDAGRWTETATGRVLYAPRLTPRLLRRCVAESGCAVVWLNSFFSRGSIAVLVLQRLGRIRVRILLAPRGEFAPSALAAKRRRKAIALRVLRSTGCLRRLEWLASSADEGRQIAEVIGASAVTCIPESVAEVPVTEVRWPTKAPGRLKAVFAARIAPVKNLLFLLEVLARCDGAIHLDIVGPLEDPEYWALCRRLLPQLPSTVTVDYIGEANHDDLQRWLAAYDVLILPTLGENFGHMIVEAWAAGCPVLVSDRTPWRQLTSQGLGWDVPLEHQAWVSAIAACRGLGAAAHLAMRRRAREQARRVWQDGVAGDASLRRLFEAAASPPAVHAGRDLVAGVAGAGDIDSCA
jgi:glycosyltransferase involved in cell wall biosynthesis